ncbi:MULTISPECIES: ABC transporter permease [unclassified Mesorhizobium]|uniref:ABC transporter permease n=1 Tax=unclassified Mesorhizobium TaxID=325217 RepID=UPI000FD6C70B|nr:MULTISPECIES: ABC transporter permease [unclassified Mesorhizobium]TGQ38378.1 ABC transporter permease [Mesorhizobium sp. M00.F.Ca.ET.216.01.1.1]TIS57035.1 MAG: ABC transporter permease subunit [Mesorhizobium sp.]TIS89270.1 MAG: ABC transporter permease subunit [Mesorhizobium sp.]TJW11915.1 MAG: ABC transporter permease subunit [Mesorhizobium sp.]TJW42449.1 MAG: ABC transporter permease subunit [Mesorhizobium sp.]
MRTYALYFVSRLAQFVLVVFIGINVAYLITHLTPIDPVEQAISSVTMFGQSSPEMVEVMRKALRELYGLEGSAPQQYVTFWKRLATGDFGPSLSAFPTPVSTLIWQALPWTVGLLVCSTLIAWMVGNFLGGLAGYYRRNILLKALGIVAMSLQPIPYYIVAFILLIVFGFLWPVLPISGGAEMNIDRQGFAFAASIIQHSILPALSLVLVGMGAWFIGMRSLVSNIVTEDYVTYAELGGVDRRRILFSYVMRNALSPQVTGLALSLGAIFNGAIITEVVFGYPGLGTLLVRAVNAGDYSLVLGITSVSIIAVAAAILVIDIIYPLLDPRVVQG